MPKKPALARGAYFMVLGPEADILTHLYSILNVCLGTESLRIQYKDGPALTISYKNGPKNARLRDYQRLIDALIKETPTDEYDT